MSLMTERDARLLSPLQLAYVGDAVHSLLVRTRLLSEGLSQKDAHKRATAEVNACAQARAIQAIFDSLTEEERDIAKRGRNAHSRHPAPKAASKGEYAWATGYEALLGYRYLTGGLALAQSLFEMTLEETVHA